MEFGTETGDESGEAVAEALVDFDLEGGDGGEKLEDQVEGRFHVAAEHGTAGIGD